MPAANSSFSVLLREKHNSFSHADKKMMERILTKSLTHRSSSPKGDQTAIFKVSKAQFARQNITFETRDGQARRISQ